MKEFLDILHNTYCPDFYRLNFGCVGAVGLQLSLNVPSKDVPFSDRFSRFPEHCVDVNNLRSGVLFSEERERKAARDSAVSLYFRAPPKK